MPKIHVLGQTLYFLGLRKGQKRPYRVKLKQIWRKKMNDRWDVCNQSCINFSFKTWKKVTEKVTKFSCFFYYFGFWSLGAGLRAEPSIPCSNLFIKTASLQLVWKNKTNFLAECTFFFTFCVIHYVAKRVWSKTR